MASSTTSTVVSKDKNGNAKNTYTIKYEPSANKITLTIDTNSAKSLSAYKTGTLDWETIEIKCTDNPFHYIFFYSFTHSFY